MRLVARFRGQCTDGCAAQSAQRVVATIRSTLATGALCRFRGFLIAAPVPERVSIACLQKYCFDEKLNDSGDVWLRFSVYLYFVVVFLEHRHASRLALARLALARF